MRYDLDSLNVRAITEFKKYHGVNVSINTYLDRTRIPVSIDVGFGDVVYPERVKIDFPVLLNMDEPHIYAYSIYSAIAEKFEAFTSLGLINGRYKDFYDIYILAGSFDLSGEKLKKAVEETFLHRGTAFDDIAAFEDDFLEDVVRKKRWDSFIKKKKAMELVAFEDVMERIKRLLLPVVEAIQLDLRYDKVWSAKSLQWK